jgi:manganese efflux pump family protein
MLALLLVACALGLSNFAAAIGIGVSGTGTRTRLRVGIIFGIFEAGMPVAGLALGRGLAGSLGHSAHWAGAALLIATGAYGLIQARWPGPAEDQPPSQHAGRLVITGFALSIDNLAVGFALGTYHLGLAVSAAVIGGVSVAMSLVGLELGARIGIRTGRYGEYLGAAILLLVGAAIAAGLI